MIKEERFKIPDIEEQREEDAVEVLLQRERNLSIQNYLAPDLTGRWEGG